MGAETACPDASKFEIFILPVQLALEPEMFKPPIGISVFGSETRITRPIASKICTKNGSQVPHLSSKTQVFTLICLKVKAFFTFVAELVIFLEKNIRTSDAKPRGSPNKGLELQIYCFSINVRRLTKS